MKIRRSWWGASLLLVLLGCGGQDEVEIKEQFVSQEFNFEISLPGDMAQNGWLIVHARDATVTHQYVAPDSSDIERIAVVVPPAQSFPLFSPFFADVFRLRDPEMTARQLADLRAVEAGDFLIGRQSLTVNGVAAEELIHGVANDVFYETFLAYEGLAYSINTSGAPETSTVANQFFVVLSAYRDVVQTFRFLE